jgi:two-component system, cell cycle sensor histidine kinase and response regulator CckA
MAREKQAREKALAIQESLLQLIETTDAIVVVLNSEGKIQYINEMFKQVTGYSAEELEDAPWFETLVPKERYPQVWEEFERLTAEGTMDRFENPILTKSGEERYIVWRNSVVRRRDEVIGTASIGIDISERKRAEEALRDSEEKLLAVFRSVPVGIAVTDADGGRIYDVNQEYERIFECSYDDVVGKTSTELGLWVDPEDRQCFIDAIEKDGKAENLDLALQSRGGRELTVRVNALPLTAGGSHYLVYALEDITERKQIEEQLEVLRRWIDGYPEGAFWIDTDDKLVYINDPGCQVIGYEHDEVLGQNVNLMNPLATPERMKAIWKMLRRDGSLFLESVHRRKDGSEFPVELMINLVRVGGKEFICGFSYDLSERKQAQEERTLLARQLQQSQKMEAVGRLADGVAHNFNNILTALGGYCELLLTKLPEGSDGRLEAEQIKRAADHAAVITSELLVFSRREATRPVRLDLNTVVVQTQLLLRELVRGDIKIVTALAPVVPLVLADRSQIEQVIISLVVNARDAMPNGGSIAIETANLDLAEPLLEGNATLDAGRYVALVVKDSGSGMDESTLAHIFEPFFTTKSRDEGTGLGLATVYGIVEESGGQIHVESKPNSGTKFTIFLPALPVRG